MGFRDETAREWRSNARAKAVLHIWEDAFLLRLWTLRSSIPSRRPVRRTCATTLSREAMPILRYRTKDLTRVVAGDCPCGRVHKRIDRIRGRSDDMFIIKGVNIFPTRWNRS